MSIFYIDLQTDFTERFDISKFMSFENDVHDPLTSFFFQKLKSLPVRGKYKITVDSGRPEFISQILFGNTQYWWLIMEYNDLLYTSELVNGLEINYFSLNELEDLYFSLVTNELNDKIVDKSKISETRTIDLGNIIVESTETLNGDAHLVYSFSNLSIVTIDHNLNKRPVARFLSTDLNGDEIEEEVFVKYPVGFETSRVIINFGGELRSGKIILN